MFPNFFAQAQVKAEVCLWCDCSPGDNEVVGVPCADATGGGASEW